MKYLILKNCIETQGCYVPQLLDSDGIEIEVEDPTEANAWFGVFRSLRNGRYVLVSIVDDTETPEALKPA